MRTSPVPRRHDAALVARRPGTADPTRRDFGLTRRELDVLRVATHGRSFVANFLTALGASAEAEVSGVFDWVGVNHPT
jgi:hypothetical protein